jgi:hypothetical protein
MTLISEQTASGSASISFTSGIDSTYPIYRFEFINCHPSINNASFEFQGSTDGGSNYNTTKQQLGFMLVIQKMIQLHILFMVLEQTKHKELDFKN